MFDLKTPRPLQQNPQPAAEQIWFRRYIKPNIGLISVLSVAFAIIGAVISMKFVPGQYKAEAVFQVAPLMPRVLYATEESQPPMAAFYDSYRRTLAQKLTERRVLELAIKRLDDDHIAWRRPDSVQDEDLTQLRARLNIQVVRDSQLISVSISDSAPEILVPILNAISASFIEQIALDESLKTDAKLQTLRVERAKAAQELDKVNEDLQKLVGNLGGSELITERSNPLLDRIRVLEESQIKARIERHKAEGAYASAQEIGKRSDEPISEALVTKSVEQDPALKDARLQFERLETENAARNSHMGREHPQRQSSEALMAAQKQRLASLVEQLRERERGALNAERSIVVRERLAMAHDALIESGYRLESAKRVETELSLHLEAARKRLVEFGTATMEVNRMKSRLQGTAESLSAIDRRMEQIQMESRAPGRVVLCGQPEDPRRAGWSSSHVLGLMGAVAGFFIGIGTGGGIGLAFEVLRGTRVVKPVLVAESQQLVPQCTAGE